MSKRSQPAQTSRAPTEFVNMHCVRQSFIAIALCAMLGACTLAPSADSDVNAADVRLSAAVKLALVATPDLSAAAIDVIVTDGRVRLEGFVETVAQRAAAENAARQVDGVRGLSNELEVK